MQLTENELKPYEARLKELTDWLDNNFDKLNSEEYNNIEEDARQLYEIVNNL